MNSFDKLYSQLYNKSREYCYLLLLKRFFILIIFTLSFCLFFSFIDYCSNLSLVPRRTFAFSLYFLISILFCCLVVNPFLLIFNSTKRIKYYISIIQLTYPDVKDLIINIFELKSSSNSELAKSSIEQKSKHILSYNYINNIIKTLHLNYKYPIIILVLFITSFFLRPNIYRIIFYDVAPDYSISINSNLQVLSGNDVKVDFTVTGDIIPDKIYITDGNFKYLVSKVSNTNYTYTFRNIYNSFSFNISIDNYNSDCYLVNVYNKPILQHVAVDIIYPKYTLLSNKRLNYFSDVNVPQGTIIKYDVISNYTDTVIFNTVDKTDYFLSLENSFIFQQTLKENSDYEIVLANNFISECVAKNKISVIPDEYPTISVGQYIQDSIIIFNGIIDDDYGFSKLLFVSNIDTVDLKIEKRKNNQKFSYIAHLPNRTNDNNIFTYYFEIFDNDAVNGIKSSKSKIESITLYSKSENEIANISKEQFKYQQVSSKASTILSSINQLLQSKMFDNKLSWENKQLIDQINQQGEELSKWLSELKIPDNTLTDLLKILQQSDDKNLNQLLNRLKDIIESKQRQINSNNQLIDNILKDKLLLYVAENISQLANQHRDLQNINNVDSLNNKLNDIKDQFERITDQYNKTGDKTIYDDIKELNNQYMNLENQLINNNLEQFKNQNNNIKQKLESIAERLQQNQNSNKKNQNYENADVLRQILDNLLQISFNQEDIILSLRPLPYSSNEYSNIISRENNLKDDFSFVKDSLYALASRTEYLGNFVFDNANQIDYNITESIDLLNDRKKTNALKCHNQVLKFTNDLISLLVESLENMEQSMSGEGNNNNSKRKQKPKNVQPSIEQMRNEQQNLEKQMQQMLQQMQQQGISENDILKLFSQTEMIKQQFDKFLSSNKFDNRSSNELKKIQELIEKNRRELLSKRFDNQILNRQHQITTKMLDYEKAQEERDFDEKRKSKEAIDIEKKDVRDINNIIIFEENDDVLQYKNIKLNTFYLNKYEDYIRNVNNMSNE